MHHEAQHLRGLQPRIQHVVSVAHPSDDLAKNASALLDESENISQYLTRMMIVGESVDDRHPRIFGKGFNHVLMKGANHHHVHHAADHARQIFYRLAARNLRRLTGKKDRRAAKLVHAGFKRNASAS